MGSFNIACGLSGLPITEGDRAAFIPISASKCKVESIGPSITDPCQFYGPVLPPVTGTYDGYGRLRGIEPSVTTVLIERIMNRPIDTALQVFTDTRRFYGAHGLSFDTYVTKPGHIAKYDATAMTILKSLGFERMESSTEVEYVFHGAAVLFQAGYASHIRSARRRITPLRDSSITEALQVFGAATGIYPGVAEEDQEAARMANCTTGMFVHPDVLTGMAEVISDDVVYRRAAKTVATSWDDLQERIARMDPAHPEHDRFRAFPSSWSANDLVDAMRHYASWEPEQYGYLQRLDPASVLSMMQVVDVANALGRTLGPTQVLSEIDSVEYAQAAHHIAGSILKRQTDRWE